MIADYDDGAIHLDNYRGRSVLGFYEQAAEFFVRRELGLTSIAAVTAVRRARATPGTFAVDIDDDGERAHCRGPASLGPSRAAVTPLTCTGPLGQRVPSLRARVASTTGE